jgi:hypothetical protein
MPRFDGRYCTDRAEQPLKLALTSLTSGDRSVGIVRLRTKTAEFVCLFLLRKLKNISDKLVNVINTRLRITMKDLLQRLPDTAVNISHCQLNDFEMKPHEIILDYFVIVGSSSFLISLS